MTSTREPKREKSNAAQRRADQQKKELEAMKAVDPIGESISGIEHGRETKAVLDPKQYHCPIHGEVTAFQVGGSIYCSLCVEGMFAANRVQNVREVTE